MSTLLPPRLRPGDKVGVVTPSWPVSFSPSPDPAAEFDAGIDQLRTFGFEPVVGEHALAETGYTAGSPQARAADINTMFADPEVKAVISSHGGYVAAGVLPHLEWDTIAANPTIFMGFSDATTLVLAIHAVTGMVTFHGPMTMWNLGQSPDPYELTEFMAMLSDGRTGPMAQRLPWRTVRGGNPGRGKLLGDGIGLRAMLGTPYELAVNEDVVLFFEGMVDSGGATDTRLRLLTYTGVFDHVRGVLVGSDGSSFAGKKPEVPFSEILMEVTQGYDFPIVECDDFGHDGVNTVLPVGATATLDPVSSQLVIDEPFLA